MLIWLGHHTRIRPPGLFALYVTGYSAFRIFEESLRIDSSEHFLGLRLNFYVASILTLAGIIWFIASQRKRAEPAGPAEGSDGEPAEAVVPAAEADSPADGEPAAAETDAGARQA